ncbi:hypothetical protein GYB22_10025 [bacterium]|nr:hypothetical protein [bacterium]
MLKLISTCLLGLITFLYFDLGNNETKPHIGLEIQAMNLLYVGLDNVAELAVEGYKNEDLILTSTAGLNISPAKDGLYNLKVDGSSREVYVRICTVKRKDTFELGTKKYRVRRLPNPIAQLGGIPNDGQPRNKAQVLAQTSILASMGQGFAHPLNYRVQSYHFALKPLHPRDSSFEAIGTGSALSAEMRNIISVSGAGDQIIISEIKATEAQYGWEADLSPIRITLR